MGVVEAGLGAIAALGAAFVGLRIANGVMSLIGSLGKLREGFGLLGDRLSGVINTLSGGRFGSPMAQTESSYTIFGGAVDQFAAAVARFDFGAESALGKTPLNPYGTIVPPRSATTEPPVVVPPTAPKTVPLRAADAGADIAYGLATKTGLGLGLYGAMNIFSQLSGPGGVMANGMKPDNNMLPFGDMGLGNANSGILGWLNHNSVVQSLGPKYGPDGYALGTPKSGYNANGSPKSSTPKNTPKTSEGGWLGTGHWFEAAGNDVGHVAASAWHDLFGGGSKPKPKPNLGVWAPTPSNADAVASVPGYAYPPITVYANLTVDGKVLATAVQKSTKAQAARN
jgi:hypothetical protein